MLGKSYNPKLKPADLNSFFTQARVRYTRKQPYPMATMLQILSYIHLCMHNLPTKFHFIPWLGCCTLALRKFIDGFLHDSTRIHYFSTPETYKVLYKSIISCILILPQK